MTKKIGIVGWKTGESSFGITTAYAQYLNQFGNVKILSPVAPEDIDLEMDLLVLPGGPDINPAYYKQVPDFSLSRPCPYKEYFDEYLLPVYIEKNIPIFGICRGHQALGIHFGLDMRQDLNHIQNDVDRTKLVHEVILTQPGKILINQKPFGNNKEPKFEVNSMHHQGFILSEQENLQQKKVIIYGSSKDGVIEAMGHSERPIISVQWHPEEIYDAFSAKAISKLLTFKQ